MKTLQVNVLGSAKKTYPIIIGNTLMLDSKHLQGRKVVIITDHTIKKLYAREFNKIAKNALVLSFPAGEGSKNYTTKIKLENALLKNKYGRDSIIIAVGGGVVGDIAGFIAATYMRGIPYIQIPTTILSMVDSSVGGKTGINTDHGKNLVGAFHQPTAVLINLEFVKSLPLKQRKNGLVEALKIFCTHDKNAFNYLVKHTPEILDGNIKILEKIIFRAIQLKMAIVARDEKETGERKLLNFGHTIGHALEYLSKYELPHGIAVAYGIVVEATLSNRLGILSAKDYIKIKSAITQLGINLKYLTKFSHQDIVAATKLDKKVKGHQVHYVLLKSIGCCKIISNAYTRAIADKTILDTLRAINGA